MVEVIVAACRDETGQRIFDAEDRLTLIKSGDSRVVERIAQFILQPFYNLDESGETGAGSAAKQ